MISGGGFMRTCASILAVATVLLQATNAAQACGDKFLLVGRGVEFHRAYAAVYPASIVIYSRLPGDAAKAIRDARFQGVPVLVQFFCGYHAARFFAFQLQGGRRYFTLALEPSAHSGRCLNSELSVSV